MGHRFSEATCENPKTCTVCGATEGAALGHVYTEATCLEPKICTVCGKTEGSALAHDYAPATCTEPETCIVCGETNGKALGHKYGKVSCTEASKCSVCEEEKKAVGHLYNPATCTAPKTCNVCGETEGEPKAHNFVNGKCKDCGAVNDPFEDIKKICGLKAPVQNNVSICTVDVDSDHNPYDVVYDYGPEYNAMVERCDWSLVFDAAYYKKTFPALAFLYHYDDALLLEHYQTVGVHEGRQANESFNVNAYYYNCDYKIYKAFEKNYEGYVFYYMLHYDEEKNVNTKTAEGKKIKKQLKQELTALQYQEYKDINGYRNEVNVEDVKYDTEVQAIANYRAYINSKENWDAHDWAKVNNNKNVWDLVGVMGYKSKLAENNITMTVSSAKNFRGKVYSKSYYESPEHYEAMVRPVYKTVGVSNCYVGKNNKLNTFKKSSAYEGSQFDFYMEEVHTAVNP